jgi:hypothetical protein
MTEQAKDGLESIANILARLPITDRVRQAQAALQRDKPVPKRIETPSPTKPRKRSLAAQP